ncbi:hypothetical protein BY458DRAFT_448397, partial [Sporodiniella umbellata]
NVARNIQKALPQHQAQISSLKEGGINTTGCCHKSDLEEQDNSINPLQRMVNNHYQRSLVDKVFVSPYPFSHFKSAYGDTQDKLILATVQFHFKLCISIDILKYISNSDNICIDFAGLSTNVSGLKGFVR